MEAVNVVDTLPREVFCFESLRDRCALSVVWGDNAEVESLIVVLDECYNSIDFLMVLAASNEYWYHYYGYVVQRLRTYRET